MKKKKTRSRQSREFEAPIKILSKGGGVVEEPLTKREVFIDPLSLNTAFPGDLVKVMILSESQGRLEGEVRHVVKRKKTQFVGRLKKENGLLYLIPDDPRIYTHILITDKKTTAPLPRNTKAVVRLNHWKDPHEMPHGTLIAVLGKPLTHETEIKSILYDKELPITFPRSVESEAHKARARLKDPSIKNRRDMRGVATFTIDPADAKDFDDALSCRDLKNGTYEIGIHIADVSHFVQPNSLLDKEAALRATSIYLVDRTIPMLPETLSNDLCSLNPHEDKLAFSAVFIMTRDGEVKNEWWGKTIIQSQQRFSYEEAQEALSRRAGPFYQELSILNTIAKSLEKKRIASGAIAFRDTEVGFRLDEHMRPLDAFIKARLDTHKLIENFMLLANNRVAKKAPFLMGKKALPFIYRVHEPPDEEKISALFSLLKKMGHKVHTSSRVEPKHINHILRAVEGRPEEHFINTLAIRSMSKAYYSFENKGHFGLAFSNYTHFTSPIRRYPDIIAHRLLDAYLEKKRLPAQEILRYHKEAEHSSARERVAEEAERESVKFKLAEYMKKYIGKKMTAVISGVTRYGLYVEERSTTAEGLIPIRDLPNDFYLYDEKNYRLKGKTTGRIFRLGDTVEVRVKEVNVSRKQITFSLA